MSVKKRRRTFDAVAATLAITLTAIAGVLFWAVVALIILLCSGCTTTKYVPVEVVKTEYKDKIKEVHTTDSVTDTRFVYVKGDTIIDYRDRIKWRDRYIHDSLYIERHDSIPVPYPVERKLSRWEQSKMDFGGMAFGGVAIALCFAVVWLVKRFKR